MAQDPRKTIWENFVEASTGENPWWEDIALNCGGLVALIAFLAVCAAFPALLIVLPVVGLVWLVFFHRV